VNYRQQPARGIWPRSRRNASYSDLAKQLGADEDEGRFREKLRVIARQKPKDAAKQAAPKTPGNSRKRTVAR